MTPISHALIPVCLGSRWIPRGKDAPTWRMFLIVAASGVLPDVLDPHLYLDSRHGSWSHSLAAWAGFGAVVAAVYLVRFRGRGSAAAAALCIFAYAAHLVCDAITGGIALFLPFSDEVLGGQVLPFWAWTVSDMGFALWTYFIYRWVPLRQGLRKTSNKAPDF